MNAVPKTKRIDVPASEDRPGTVHPAGHTMKPSWNSFRDPGGRLFVSEGRVIRALTETGRRDYQAIMASAAVNSSLANGNIVATETIEKASLAEIPHLPLSDAVLFLEHRRIPFPSYPYEWAPEMLRAAADLTLDLAEAVLDDGLGFKDATPFNVLFDGPRPVLVDVLSLERRDSSDPMWLAQGQFSRTFLLPLLAHHAFGLSLNRIFLGNPAGIDPGEFYRMCSPWQRLRPPFLGQVSIPTWLTRRARSGSIYKKRRVDDPEKARFILKQLLKRQRRALRSVAPAATESSHWSDYMENVHYDAGAFEAKEKAVGETLDAIRPGWVIDIGANTGYFSEKAAQAGANVIAIDSDPVVVGALWKKAAGDGLKILPLVQNLGNPSPATGWRNSERPAFLDRARQGFDLALLLAVVHHLMVTEGIPLEEIAATTADITRSAALVEYVGKDDPQFKSLLRGRENLYSEYNQGTFEQAFTGFFEIRRRFPIPGRDRCLYLMEKVPGR